MTSREQFECKIMHAYGEDCLAVNEDGDYANWITADLWEIWQASREAVEVELPCIEDKKWYSSWHGKFREEAFWLEVKRRLTELGLKVKQ
ncbi:hypothetical protein S13b_00026 [Klebsiella phage VLCpiS13b]|uniref:hypothetical protein n=1 Tax=Klebsiella phage VLCpiS13b TaxID=2874886 RepID=UPI00233F03F9|nr:hypothetical protein PRB92_gp26 [Klebsiella phage VLCpiS13b]UVX30603.1 hypothetical protein S13b_00026 [Klebsiella phage VLCpiS13b]